MRAGLIKYIVVAGLSCSPVAAAANDELVKGFIGAIVGGMGQAMVNDQGRRQEQMRFNAQQEQEQLQARAEIQRRLNMLGFDAGVPDGSFGGRTRNAISRYQASIGQKSTGRITEAQVHTLYRLSNNPALARSGQQPQPQDARKKNLLATVFADQGGTASESETATAYSEPAQPSARAAQSSEIWQEPTLPTAGAEVAQANGAQAWSEPSLPKGSEPRAADREPVSQADSKESIRTVIRNAICSADSSSVASIKSFMSAEVVDKAFVDHEMRTAIDQCVSRSDIPLKALFDVNGKDVTVPYWAKIRKVSPAAGSEMWYGHSFPKEGDVEWIRLDMTYPQYVLLNWYGRNSGYKYLEDPDFVRQLKGNETKRDCLGYPPIYYAAIKDDLTFFNWLMENGANPNIVVPFTSSSPSVSAEAINLADKIKGNNSTGYTLNAQYACVNLGPSAALMNSYAKQDSLIPVWSLALRRYKSNQTVNFPILKKMMDMVPSVPPSMLVDIIDDEAWPLRINEPQDVEIVKILVSKGADLNALTRKGKRPLAIWTADGIGKSSLEQILALGARI